MFEKPTNLIKTNEMTNTEDISTSVTPMMKQYKEIKGRYLDSLLFYRLGDFYELFYNDAEIVSKKLGLVLTKRANVPMCGVPWHAHEMYLTKLINMGYKIAICEQLETPEEAKKRGRKETIRRDVTRVITNGTLIESSLISEKQSNFLLAIAYNKEKLGIAYADISTGTFKIEDTNPSELLTILAKINPSEIICADNILTSSSFLETLSNYRSIIHPIPSSKFMTDTASKRLAKFYGIKFIDAIGEISTQCIDAASMIVEYVSDAYLDTKVCLPFPQIVNKNDYMYIDHFTRKSLEINTSLSGNKKCSLLSTIDRTMTSQSARLLADWVSNPLCNIEKIEKRLSLVEFFVNNRDIAKRIQDILEDFPDIERALSRITINKCGPIDLHAIKFACKKICKLNDIILQVETLKNLDLSFEKIDKIIESLDEALKDENLPHLTRDGNFIKPNYNENLDELNNIINNGEYFIEAIQKRYATETGISNLKIKNNGILGCFIETSPNNISKIPYDFIHKQSLASCIRYTTPELSDIETKIRNAESDALKQELLIFEELRVMIEGASNFIRNTSKKISFIDCITSLATLAIENNYIKPTIIEDSHILDIQNGRHPVVEKYLLKDGETFIENDCSIDQSSVISIITGPNMGGKSTYLRQNAIIIIMAQIGSYVPASKAIIGITDKIFSRVGANDDISSGKSTFMVEMIETAVILRQATNKSFIILDEIGRGTSTYDGLAIAWAVVEEIHNSIRARTLLATHYHELKKISQHISNVKFLNVQVAENNNQIIFMHKIKDGFADKSYGIHVASISGFPDHVVTRANELLSSFQ